MSLLRLARLLRRGPYGSRSILQSTFANIRVRPPSVACRLYRFLAFGEAFYILRVFFTNFWRLIWFDLNNKLALTHRRENLNSTWHHRRISIHNHLTIERMHNHRSNNPGVWLVHGTNQIPTSLYAKRSLMGWVILWRAHFWIIEIYLRCFSRSKYWKHTPQPSSNDQTMLLTSDTC